jgi:poly-beta-1,6-N-acetyl-D-glucosamine biosynthesis protein PgaD
MSARAIIIDAPEFRSINLRYRDWMLTILLWGLWILICRHLLLFFGWVMGIYNGILQIDAMLEMRHVADPLMLYGAIAAANGTVLILWAVWNEYRSAGRDRRSVARCGSARRLVMHHDSDGRLAAIDSNRHVIDR